jgi:hypothetical protein
LSTKQIDEKADSSVKVERNILPIPDRPQFGLTTYDAKDPDTKYPPIKEVRPPAGAPNVLVILIDDAAVYPFSYNRSLFSDSSGTFDWP